MKNFDAAVRLDCVKEYGGAIHFFLGGDFSAEKNRANMLAHEKCSVYAYLFMVEAEPVLYAKQKEKLILACKSNRCALDRFILEMIT